MPLYKHAIFHEPRLIPQLKVSINRQVTEIGQQQLEWEA